MMVAEDREEDDDEEEEWQHLPSFHEIVRRFSLFCTSATCDPQVGPGGSLYCNCQGCREWYAFVGGDSPFCKEVQYEVLTAEHVKGVANYLRLRAAEYRLAAMEVLEVGAGSGRLSYHLNRFLEQLSRESKDFLVHVTASDSGERGLNGPNVNFQDALESVTEWCPHVVMVSWMPMGVDWTARVRATQSVLEYILIGEMDDGICGDPWLTWGCRASGDDSSETNSDRSSSDHSGLDLRRASEDHGCRSFADYGLGKAAVIVASKNTLGENESSDRDVGSDSLSVANVDRISSEQLRPYEADGWVRIELENLSKLQICRTDERWSSHRHSRTVSFRRLT